MMISYMMPLQLVVGKAKAEEENKKDEIKKMKYQTKLLTATDCLIVAICKTI